MSAALSSHGFATDLLPLERRHEQDCRSYPGCCRRVSLAHDLFLGLDEAIGYDLGPKQEAENQRHVAAMAQSLPSNALARLAVSLSGLSAITFSRYGFANWMPSRHCGPSASGMSARIVAALTSAS